MSGQALNEHQALLRHFGEELPFKNEWESSIGRSQSRNF